MSEITLDKIHEDIMGLRKDIEHIKSVVDEEYELVDDVVIDIKKSKNRAEKEFVSHEEMRKEFE